MAVLWMFRKPSLCRHVHRELLRSVLLDVTPIISATTCHQRHDVERYSTYKLSDALSSLARSSLVALSGDWQRSSSLLLARLHPRHTQHKIFRGVVLFLEERHPGTMKVEERSTGIAHGPTRGKRMAVRVGLMGFGRIG